MDFNPINTQEEFDARVAEVYGDVAGLQGQITALTGERDTHAGTIADLQKQIKGFQVKDLRANIARRKGIPAELAHRLSGETEQEITADADAMAAALKTVKGTAPLFDPNTQNPDNSTTNFATMLHELRGE